MISMKDILKQIEFLPVFNQTAQKALQLLLQYDTNNKDIAEVIKYDPGLTANVLKLANSAYFAHTKEINDLTGAINYLGRDKMFQILTLSTASKYFQKPAKGYEQIQGELWKHSISTGVIAEHLSFLEPTINKLIPSFLALPKWEAYSKTSFITLCLSGTTFPALSLIGNPLKSTP